MKRTPLRRFTPLRSMSVKRARDQRKRRELVWAELARRELCEAGAIIYQGRVSAHGKENADLLNSRYARCDGLSVDLHEPLTRARGGSFLDVDNTVAVCRSCHTWIHDNPAAAKAVGLLRSS